MIHLDVHGSSCPRHWYDIFYSVKIQTAKIFLYEVIKTLKFFPLESSFHMRWSGSGFHVPLSSENLRAECHAIPVSTFFLPQLVPPLFVHVLVAIVL